MLKIFGIISFLFIVVLAFLAIFLNKNIPPHIKKDLITPLPTPTITQTPEAMMFFHEQKLSLIAGQNSEADIDVDTQGEMPNLVQIELAYDPAAINEVTLVPGDLFENPDVILNNIDEKTGRISFAISVAENTKPERNSGIAAKLIFRVNKPVFTDKTVISFLPKSVVYSGDKIIPLMDNQGLSISINSKETVSTRSGLLNPKLEIH